MSSDKIDIVIPWVDGSDPKWIEKKNKYDFKYKEHDDTLVSDIRYRDYNTLKYALRSIEKNMSWINRVFLVSDNQTPSWIDTDYVTIVDHKYFIPEMYLPTFNSSVIMTNLNKIPELSENFILGNDDIIVWDELNKDDFFKNGVPVDCLIEIGYTPTMDQFMHISNQVVANLNNYFDKKSVIKNNFNKFFNFRYGKYNIANLLSLPYKHFIGFYNQHVLASFRKSEFKEAQTVFSDAFISTWENKFRSTTDVNEWLVSYFRNLKGDFVPGLFKRQLFNIVDFKDSMPNIKNDTQMLCINDGIYNGNEAFNRIEKLLSLKFPDKSKYEK